MGILIRQFYFSELTFGKIQLNVGIDWSSVQSLNYKLELMLIQRSRVIPIHWNQLQKKYGIWNTYVLTITKATITNSMLLPDMYVDRMR